MKKTHSPSLPFPGRAPALYPQAVALHQQGQLARARQAYEQILAKDPRHQGALYLAGTLAFQQGRLADAEQLLQRAAAADAKHLPTRINLAMVQSRSGQHEAALRSIDAAIRLDPRSAAAQSTRIAVLVKAEQYADALQAIDALIAQGAETPELRMNQGIALMALQQHALAEASFIRCTELAPPHWKARHQRIQTLLRREQFERALPLCDELIAANGSFADAHADKGVALTGLGDYDAAVRSLSQALALGPHESHFANLANALIELGRFQEALAATEQGLAFKPGHPPLFAAAGRAFALQGDHDSALLNYEQFLAHHAPSDSVLYLKAASLVRQKRLPEAIATLELTDTAHADYALADLIHHQAMVSDWRHIGERIAQLHQLIESDELAFSPFALLGTVDDPRLLLKAARRYVQKSRLSQRLSPLPEQPAHDKIRIGYFSADFHQHATSYLMAEVLESHDKNRFELYGFSFGPVEHDAMTERLKRSFDHFFYVRPQTNHDIVALARSCQLDIAVDLKGFTTHSRFGLFQQGCAPVQVNFLGYPGTLASEHVDYIVADDMVIPEAEQAHYAEKVVYLPDCYQCNDSQRQISPHAYTREELGLPPDAFVFCCFNNNYKILPETFQIWVNILKAVEGSVLWIFRGNDHCADHLRAHAAALGVDAERLVFADLMPLPEHLARLRLADLFLDTLPCNAHTTASDALWAGLPVLTRTGRSFQSRVAASLLRCLGLTELITATATEYEALAVRLARDGDFLTGIRGKLDSQKATSPLFDGARYTVHLEKTYEQMHQWRLAGQAPAPIRIKASHLEAD